MKVWTRYLARGALALSLALPTARVAAADEHADGADGDEAAGEDDRAEEPDDGEDAGPGAVVVEDDRDSERDARDPESDDPAAPAVPPPAADFGLLATLPEGALDVKGVFEVNMGARRVAEPLAIAPDLRYGVRDDLTIELFHSGFGQTGFFGGHGNGLCVSGDGEGGCADLYDNVGLGAQFAVLDDDLALAIDAGVHSASLSDPFLLAAKAGAVGVLSSDAIQIVFQPNVLIELADRDEAADLLNVPVAAYYLATSSVAVGAQAGLQAELDELADTWTVPLSAVVHFHIDERFRVGGAFSFPRLVADDSNTDERALNLLMSYRM